MGKALGISSGLTQTHQHRTNGRLVQLNVRLHPPQNQIKQLIVGLIKQMMQAQYVGVGQ